MPNRKCLHFFLYVTQEVLRVVLFLVMGVVARIAIISKWGLFWVWVLVETMIFSTMPLLLEKGKRRSKSEFRKPRLVAYFSAQCRGTMLILLGLFIHRVISAELAGSCLVCAGYSLKLGLFPFNFWVRSKFERFHYIGVFIRGFAQKLYIVPIVPLFYDEVICANIIYFISLLSMLCGPILMFLTTKVKMFLSHLSLRFTGVLILCSYCGLFITYIYGAVYCLRLFFIIIILLSRDCEHIKDLRLKVPLHFKVGFLCLGVSFSGFPPFVDFIIKEIMVGLLWWEAGATVRITIVLVSRLINLSRWVRFIMFASKDIKKALAFKGTVAQNLFNITCVILSLFSGFVFGIIIT